MAKQPEGKLVVAIKKRIVAEGGRPFKIHGSDEGVQEVGIPDILVCLWGLFVGIEAKLPGEDLRPRQRLVLREIYDAGGVAAVIETAGQAEKLLSTVKDRRKLVTKKGLCFDRGTTRSVFLLE